MGNETWMDHMARMLEVNFASGGWDRALIVRNEDGSWTIASAYRASDSSRQSLYAPNPTAPPVGDAHV